MTRSALVLLIAGAVTFTACEENPLEPEPGLDAELFDDFDADNDAFLDADEFRLGFDDEGVFDDMDADLDGFIGEDEFDDDLGEFGDFDADADTFLDEDEFVGGTFDVFDDDDDFLVDEPEFGVGVELF